MVFRPKFTSDGNPSHEFSVSDGNPSSNINTTDVLAINRPRLDFTSTDCEVFIPGYEIFR